MTGETSDDHNSEQAKAAGDAVTKVKTVAAYQHTTTDSDLKKERRKRLFCGCLPSNDGQTTTFVVTETAPESRSLLDGQQTAERHANGALVQYQDGYTHSFTSLLSVQF